MWVGWDGYKAYMESIGKKPIEPQAYNILLNGEIVGEINKYSGAYEIPDDSEFTGGYVVKIPNKE